MRLQIKSVEYQSTEWFELVSVGFVTMCIDEVAGKAMAKMIKEERN